MCRHLCQATGNKKNQGNMTPLKKDCKLPIIDPKEVEIQELPDTEFKIIVLKMLRELQENSSKQFRKNRKTK